MTHPQDFPVKRNQSGKCAYEGCTENGTFVRITSGGHKVKYCHGHNMQATLLFTPDSENNYIQANEPAA